MNNRYRSTPILLLLGLALPCAAQIEGRNHIITGRVLDAASHDPLLGVSLRLLLGGARLDASPVTSNTEGEFEFDCRKADYYIEAAKDGYVPARLKVSIGANYETHVTIDLVRKPSQDDSADDPAEVVSAHQLSIPAKAREAYEQGLTLLNSKKDYPAAVAEFQSAIRAFPTYYEAYAEMGVADYYGGDPSAAEQALRKSIELSSGKYPYAVFNLAELFNNAKRFADAELVAQQAIALDNSSSRGYFELARAQLGLRRAADAEQNAAKARDLQPDYPLVYLTLLNIHLALHDYVSVLQDADAYLKLVPDSPLSDQVRKTREQVERALQRAQVMRRPS
jgi:tetratricopeptide (TPR) repeat protein